MCPAAWDRGQGSVRGTGMIRAMLTSIRMCHCKRLRELIVYAVPKPFSCPTRVFRPPRRPLPLPRPPAALLEVEPFAKVAQVRELHADLLAGPGPGRFRTSFCAAAGLAGATDASRSGRAALPTAALDVLGSRARHPAARTCPYRVQRDQSRARRGLALPGHARGLYADWLKVAAEKAYHYSLLASRLAELRHAYGDFLAPDRALGNVRAHRR